MENNQFFSPIYIQELDRQVPLIDEIDTKVRNLSLNSEICLSNQIMQIKANKVENFS